MRDFLAAFCYGWWAVLPSFLHGLFGRFFGNLIMILQLLTHQYPGMRLWLSQRLTALVMAVYIVFLLVLLTIIKPVGFAAWHEFVSPVWFRLATLLFFMSLFMHAWLGVADVLKDYVFNKTLRAYMQLAVDIVLMGYLFWLVYILWNI